jgi:sugar (pentulose or hexulose) kinase
MENKFIAFDLGAESGRCVVGIFSENALELEEVHRFNTPMIESQGHLWWDVLVIYQEMLQGLRSAVGKFGDKFSGISVDTWGVDYALIDKAGRVLGYPYHYRDSRTDGMIDKAGTILPKQQIYQETGIQFAQFNTLYQFLAEKQQPTNLLETADLFLPMPNYLLYLLSGVKKAEYTIASTTQMTDPRNRQWSGEILRVFGFPESIYPEIVEPGTVLGTILPEIQDKTGIGADVPVIASASHDTAAAVASIPATETDWAFLSSGTWSLMGLELDEPVINEDSRKYNFTNEGGVEANIRFLKNIIGLWPVQECRRSSCCTDRGYRYGYPA